MGGTVRVKNLQLGMSVLTPLGVCEITGFDVPCDRVDIERKVGPGYVRTSLALEDLFAVGPESLDPDEVAAWLDGPDLIVLRARPEPCECECDCQCYKMVITRGADVKVTHQVPARGCDCPYDCCGQPVTTMRWEE